MDKEALMKYGIAAAILFGAWKYGNGMVKGAALAIAAGVVAKRVPYLKEVL